MMKTFRGFEPLMVEIGQGVERRYQEAEATEAVDARCRENLDADCVRVVRGPVVCGLSLLIGHSIVKAR